MTLMPEVAQFEPMIALDGREDGLYFYRKIIAGCREFLNPDGMILFEIGCEQGTAVSKMMQDAGFSDVQVIQDLTRHDRVVFGKL
jgi:release factor glutamine methyltransferase